MRRDEYDHKPTGRSRSLHPSLTKLTDLTESLRRRRLHRSRSRPSPSRSFSPLADHDLSPVRIPQPDRCSSGMSTSGSGLRGDPPDVERGRRLSPRPAPALPTAPFLFQLRSASTADYVVERLERRLRRLSLGDASPDRVAPLQTSVRDVPMDVCLPSPTESPQRAVGADEASRSPLPDRDAQKPLSPSRDQNVVPMILVTSVDAKHAKPLPPSAQRPSKTPFGASSAVNCPATNAPPARSERTTIPDDPFTMQPYAPAYPRDYNLTFRLPSFPSASSSPIKYAPETPTPTCRGHFGDCRGDLWEILHPPLVSGTLALPPFKLPPLSTGLFQ